MAGGRLGDAAQRGVAQMRDCSRKVGMCRGGDAKPGERGGRRETTAGSVKASEPSRGLRERDREVETDAESTSKPEMREREREGGLELMDGGCAACACAWLGCSLAFSWLVVGHPLLQRGASVWVPLADCGVVGWDRRSYLARRGDNAQCQVPRSMALASRNDRLANGERIQALSSKEDEGMTTDNR